MLADKNFEGEEEVMLCQKKKYPFVLIDAVL